jgi:hypothetical protein
VVVGGKEEEGFGMRRLESAPSVYLKCAAFGKGLDYISDEIKIPTHNMVTVWFQSEFAFSHLASPSPRFGNTPQPL